jgi:integrase
MRRRTRYQDPALRVERGQYRIQYRDTQGRKRTKCFGAVSEVTPAEAKREKNEFLRTLNNDIVKGLRRDKTLGDLIDRWKLAELPTIDRPATRRSFFWTFEKLGELREAALAVLSKPDFQQWLLGLSLAPASLRVLRANVSTLFEAGKDWGWIEANPCRGRFKLPRINRPEKAILTPEQVRTLIPLLDPESRTVFLLALLSGLRRGELEALEWSDIEPQWVSVNKTVNCERQAGPPKSAKSRRKVEIGPLLKRTLSQWRAASLSTSRLVFPPAGRGRFRSLDDILLKKILPASAKLKIPRMTWHSLRHTFNTWGHVAGIDATIMRDLMGHATVAFNQDVYSHVKQLQPTGAAARIEALMEPPSGTPNLEAIETNDLPVQ